MFRKRYYVFVLYLTPAGGKAEVEKSGAQAVRELFWRVDLGCMSPGLGAKLRENQLDGA